jgi:hydroxymethylpyrimidine/phosphomethylpyrimidine kinase
VKAWDSFQDEVDKQAMTRGTTCQMCAILAALPKEGREAVEAALNNKRTASTAIRKALVARIKGPIPSAWSINWHRRGECRGDHE